MIATLDLRALRAPALVAGCLLAAGANASSTAFATPAAALDALRGNTEDALQYRSDASSAYTLLRALGSAPLSVDDAGAAPLNRALRFLDQFGAAVGIDSASNELALVRTSVDRAGNTHVHLDQRQRGLPVFGGRLVVHMNGQGIQGLSGVFLDGLQALPRLPAQSTAALDADALRDVAKRYPQAELAIESAQLVYYRAGLLRRTPGQDYLAREVVVRSARGDVRERVFLDASRGGVINRINEIHTLLNREIYTPNQDTPAVYTEGSAAAPADVALVGDQASDPTSRAPRNPADNLYIFAGGTYELYRNLFGREGYDEGAVPPEQQVQKSVYLINDACPNAYWNGDSTNYCPGFDADDIVSHEWSHAYTEYTHGLIYQYQSGALNEAYSDIFGEMYDLVNGMEGPLGVTLTEGEYFENGGSRWVLGEDLSEAAAGLLLRDMWDPDNFGANVPVLGIPVLRTPSPGSVITSPNYYCEAGDGGGVHTNSGVPNHAFAMLVDGKEFNGVEIPAIGMTRAAHIYFHAMVNYQVPSTNFAQHADALEQSCQDLQGVPLNDVLGNASPDTITPQTCAAVAAAMLATEMRENPAVKCAYQPLLQPEARTPELCPAGQSPVTDYLETWESGGIPAEWTVTENITGDSSEDLSWSAVTDLPAPHTGFAAFMPNTFGGSCAPGGDISASFQLDSPVITVVDGGAKVVFDHLMQSEAEFDGGNLKVSINGGDFTLVPAEAFVFNGYNMTLETGAAAPVPDPVGLTGGGNTNPIAGEAAWSGSDEGETSSNWGTSIVDLAALGVTAGDTVQLRFEFGQDGCNGNLGWYVDEVAVAHCATGSRDDNTGGDNNTGGGSDAPRVAGGGRGGALGGLLLPALLLLGLRRRRG